MTTAGQACKQDDWAAQRTAWLLWKVPVLVIVAGALLSSPWQAVLWTALFSVMGVACVLNAARCGRLHCFITGPLFLLAALASALRGLDVMSLSWAWIGWGALAGTVLAHAPEWVRGRYYAGFVKG